MGFFLLHFYLNQSQINGYQGWDEILMITLISNKKLGGYKIMRNTVRTWLNCYVLIKIICTCNTSLLLLILKLCFFLYSSRHNMNWWTVRFYWTVVMFISVLLYKRILPEPKACIIFAWTYIDLGIWLEGIIQLFL